MAENTAPLNIDPPQVIEGFTSPLKLTLGRILLLERIGSPYFGPPRQAVKDCEVLPSLYIMTLSTEAALEAVNGGTLETAAYLWADKYTRADFTRMSGELDRAIREFFGLLPKASPGEAVKNPSAAMARS